jgi:hypothetical protein
MGDPFLEAKLLSASAGNGERVGGAAGEPGSARRLLIREDHSCTNNSHAAGAIHAF